MAEEDKKADRPVDKGAAPKTSNLSQLQDVTVTLSMELGRTEKTLEELVVMDEQSLVEIEKDVGEPIDILLNGKLFARGEVITVSEYFGVRVTEVIGQEQREE